MTQPTSYNPSVDDVAALILARTKNEFGDEVGTFNSETRPTDTEVNRLIALATSEVDSVVDLDDVPVEAYNDVEAVIATRTAMLIERSYFPEQVETNRSPYLALERDYNALIAQLLTAVEREAIEAITGEAPMGNRPVYAFPPAELRYEPGRPL
jgi:hypothetical protein